MDKESLLRSIEDLRNKTVEELKKDEKQARYFTALERLDEIEIQLVAGDAVLNSDIQGAAIANAAQQAGETTIELSEGGNDNMSDIKMHSTKMLDELESGPWPSFVTALKRLRDSGKRYTPMVNDLLGQLEHSYEERLGF